MDFTTTPAQEATITITIPLRKAKKMANALVNTREANFRYEAGDTLELLGRAIRAAEGR